VGREGAREEEREISHLEVVELLGAVPDVGVVDDVVESLEVDLPAPVPLVELLDPVEPVAPQELLGSVGRAHLTSTNITL
jgi:hypothetical protein